MDQVISGDHPYQSFLYNITKPARYIGNEMYQRKKQWRDQGKFALCFPDVYEIGMSHLGMKILYDEINQAEDLICERVFAPWTDLEKELRERSLPLVSLENFKPLNEFDVVGFSLQYEMTYTNILNMLDLGRIPLKSDDREGNTPIVIAGGPCATHPEPLAPFIDLFLIGDGEDLLPELLRRIKNQKNQGKNRNEILKSLQGFEGVYIPSLHEVVQDQESGFKVVEGNIKKHIYEGFSKKKFPVESPIPHMTAIFDRYAVELSRGCTEGCRFCQAGMIYRPVRERSPKDVIENIKEGIEKGGFTEASLTCLSTADYSAVTPMLLDLLEDLNKEKISLGISSLRAYGLDPEIFDKMAEVKNTALTFAPEAGSERMRKVINKNISEDDLLKTSTDVFSRGWQKIKLYYMIGLPTETDEDIRAIMDTSKKVLETGRSYQGKRAQVTVSVSSFVPKPHTPFQWEPMISLDEIKRKQEDLFLLSRDYRLSYRKHFSKVSILEGVIARGDRDLSNVILDAFMEGARFDGWEECFNHDLWMRAFENNGVNYQKYLNSLSLEGRLPWDHIDIGVKKEFLLKERNKAFKDILSLPCGKVSGAKVHYNNLLDHNSAYKEQGKKLVCYHCGLSCDLYKMVKDREEYLSEIKANEKRVYVPKKKEEKIVNKIIGGVSYRFQFSKVGPISFLSHLDMQKVIARIFKRAGVKVLMSEGFNPKPQFSFGAALGLGVSSLSEFLDVRVEDHFDNEEKTLKLLNENSEEGIRFSSVEFVPNKKTSIQALTKGFVYFVPVEHADLKTKLDNMLSEENLFLETFHAKKNMMVQKDLRPYIESMEISTFGTKKGIKSKIKSLDGKTIKPMDLLKILERFELYGEQIIKTEILF